MIPYTIDGVDCLIEMTAGSYVEPDPSADNPDDYYGGWDNVNFRVLHLDGTPAPELDKMLTANENAKIITALAKDVS